MNDESYWHTDDKAWMRARKELWRTIKHNLDVLSSESDFKRADHKYHKELFLYGTVNPEVGMNEWDTAPDDGYQYRGGKPFLYMLPIFQIWYHPEPSKLNLDELRNNYLRYGDIGSHAKNFFDYIGGCADPSEKVVPADYGMMGGREELCVHFFCPEPDCLKPISDLNTGEERDAPLTTYHLNNYCQDGTMRELYRDARFTPNEPGQYLWEHFSYALEHYASQMFTLPNSHMSYREQQQRLWLEIIAEILRFEKRTDRSRNRPSTIAMVERLIGMYERKEFSDAMLAMWDEAKRDIKKLEPTLWFPYFDAARLDKRYAGFPVEQQEARVSQWKQN